MKSRQTASQVARETQANKAFTKRLNDVPASDGIHAREAKRVSMVAAKTGKLRALREARDASEQSLDAAAPPKKASRPPRP